MARRSKRTQRSRRSGGGTLLGILIGLVVGLAIAVAAALYMTKASVPFVDKGRRPPADLEATRQHALGAATADHAVLHDLPNPHQASIDFGVAAPVAFVATHHLGDRAPARAGQFEQLGATAKWQR